MTEAAPTHDELDLADQAFWHPVPLAERLTNYEPVESLSEFAIGDLTDAEWEAFWSAIHE